MARYKVYLTVHFEAEVEADSLEAAEAIGNVMDYDQMNSYDESDFRVEEIEENHEPDVSEAQEWHDFDPDC